RRAAPLQPLSLPRLPDDRLEPSGDRQPALGREPADLPVLGGPAGGEAGRAGVLAAARRRRLRRNARRVRHRPRALRRCAVRGDSGVSWWTEVPSSPYKGLAPFGYSDVDALLFFGRDREREILVANLVGSRLTVLYGPTGVGKSSLLA